MQQRARMRFRYFVCNAVAEIQLGRKPALSPLCMGGSNGPRCSGDPCNFQPEPIDEFVHPSTEAPPLGYDRLFGQGANKRPRLMQPPLASPERTRPFGGTRLGSISALGPSTRQVGQTLWTTASRGLLIESKLLEIYSECANCGTIAAPCTGLRNRFSPENWNARSTVPAG